MPRNGSDTPGVMLGDEISASIEIFGDFCKGGKKKPGIKKM